MSAGELEHLAHYLEESTRRFPRRTAVVDPEGWSLTYEELNQRADAIAGFLRANGVGPADRVGLALPKGANTLSAIFGVLKARAAYVPVDFSAPAERNRTIFGDCQVKALFVDPRAKSVLDLADGVPAPSVVIVVVGDASALPGTSNFAFDEVLAHAPLTDRSGRAANDLAYILYTSGSTGVPKGVKLSHENATSFVDWCSSIFEPTEHDRFSSHAPFHFDLSVLDLFVSIKHGAAVCIISESVGKNPKELAELVERQRLTIWYSTPSILTALHQFGDLSSRDLSTLRLVLFAGEVFPVKHLREIVARLPHAAFFNLYGPTETNVCTFAKIPPVVPAERTEPYPIGPVCSHCEALVLEQPDGVEVSRGEEGLLYIAGAPVFGGYWNRPVENAAAFIERSGKRWYNTGDVTREDPEHGFIYLGRRDRMVKRRGYRIELDEIEKALYRHESIEHAAVVAVPDPDAGVKIIAFLTTFAGVERPSIIGLKSFCGQKLLAYMNPDVFRFLPAMPRTSTNKVDYQSLVREARGGT